MKRSELNLDKAYSGGPTHYENAGMSHRKGAGSDFVIVNDSKGSRRVDSKRVDNAVVKGASDKDTLEGGDTNPQEGKDDKRLKARKNGGGNT